MYAVINTFPLLLLLMMMMMTAVAMLVMCSDRSVSWRDEMLRNTYRNLFLLKRVGDATSSYRRDKYLNEWAVRPRRSSFTFASLSSSFFLFHCAHCGSSPFLAYCTIFIIMSSEVVDLRICICICTSHCLYLCTHTLRAAAALP